MVFHMQVESVLSTNVFHRPSAVLALQVIGGGKPSVCGVMLLRSRSHRAHVELECIGYLLVLWVRR